jgi:hypothetical protein
VTTGPQGRVAGERWGGRGGWILAEDPEALRDAIRADYPAGPVSRDARLSRRAPLVRHERV